MIVKNFQSNSTCNFQTMEILIQTKIGLKKIFYFFFDNLKDDNIVWLGLTKLSHLHNDCSFNSFESDSYTML